MPQSYTLLNNKGNVIKRNRWNLIKMDSNFKIENGSDMENNTETEPKTRHSTSASEPGEVNKPWENVTQLWQISSSGLKIIFFLLSDMMSIMDAFHAGHMSFMSDIFTLPLAKL